MKSIVLAGIALIVLGLVAISYNRINYTTKEKVVDIGPLQATKQTTKSIPLPPILGIISLAAGVVLVVAAARGSN